MRLFPIPLRMRSNEHLWETLNLCLHCIGGSYLFEQAATDVYPGFCFDWPSGPSPNECRSSLSQSLISEAFHLHLTIRTWFLRRLCDLISQDCLPLKLGQKASKVPHSSGRALQSRPFAFSIQCYTIFTHPSSISTTS